MESIALKLKTRRESLNISLAQVANDTRISLRHLESLENGSYYDLPGGMYNRAILRAYCDELGLDKDEILRCYEEERSPREEKPVISSPQQQSAKIKNHKVVVFCILILIFGSGIYLSWEWIVSAWYPYFSSDSVKPHSELPTEQRQIPSETINESTVINTTADTTADSAADTTADSVAGSVAGSVVKTTQSAPPGGNVNSAEKPPERATNPAFTANNADMYPLRLEIVGTDECWLSVDSDESGPVVKTLSPGDVEFFTAHRKLFITVGNAGGVSLRINERQAKPLGQVGQVARFTIDKETLQNSSMFP